MQLPQYRGHTYPHGDANLRCAPFPSSILSLYEELPDTALIQYVLLPIP